MLEELHHPDLVTPVEETLSALDDLVRSGKVRYIGHSNRAGWQIAEAEFVARQLGTERYISAQNHYNLLDRRAELEVLPAAKAYGLGVLPYFPLAPSGIDVVPLPSRLIGATAAQVLLERIGGATHPTRTIVLRGDPAPPAPRAPDPAARPADPSARPPEEPS